MKTLMVFPHRGPLERSAAHLGAGAGAVVYQRSHGVGLCRVMHPGGGELVMVVVRTREDMLALRGTQWDLVLEDSTFGAVGWGPRPPDWHAFVKIALLRRS